MKRHLGTILTALLLVCAMLLSGCIKIITPTNAPTESTKTDPTVKPTETEPPTQKTEAPTTAEPETEPPLNPPEAKEFEALPILVGLHGMNDWYASASRNRYWVTWPQFSVLGQDWPELSDALDKWNSKADVDGISTYNGNLREAQEKFDPALNGWTDVTEAKIQRADEKILSVLLECISYHGGVHDATAYSALNVDPKTGKEIALSDLVPDPEAFTEWTLSDLDSQYKDNGGQFRSDYHEAFRDMIGKELKGEKVEGLSWVLLADHLRIIVDEYILAPYSFGAVTVDVPFFEDKTLYLDADYCAACEGFFRSFWKDGKNFNAYMTMDGSEGNSVSVVSIPGEYYGDYEIWVGDKCIKRDAGLGVSTAWLAGRDGSYYAYVEYSYENSYTSTDIFKVAPNSVTYVDTAFGSFMPVTYDPDHLLWKENGDALGTWYGYAKARILNNGLIERGDYFLNNKDDVFYHNSKRKLVTKMDIRVFPLGDLNQEIQVAKGTSLVPFATDFKSYVDVILPDGRLARIRYTYDKEHYSYLIDGVDQFDVFDGIMYAG